MPIEVLYCLAKNIDQQLGYKQSIPTLIKKRKVNTMKQYTKVNNVPQTYTWEYHVFSEQHTHPDVGIYRSYGIRVFRNSDEHIYPVTAIHDVTTIQTQAERLTELCNRHQLSPIHLEDMISDFLAEL